ncbi:hypothetical protein QR680_014975 [Steinernema hermaphroditum]|uniref:RlpA-like protein double-psi beta-barrel domain-containing protein n=1 Tax=Steinernema hermaphroditum TaxID=289476 RepID=A0AA39M4S2_9BILA|nr:hypothetical protein QR680_014975 [Steinernema hermaphroditum]
MLRPLVLLLALFAVLAFGKGKIPFGQQIKGHFTYFEDTGDGACGDPIDANKQMLVAAPEAYWTGGDSDEDPICKNVCVEVRYKNKKITVPVKDQCPSKYCKKDHFDMSVPAYKALEPDMDIGDVHGATFVFKKC